MGIVPIVEYFQYEVLGTGPPPRQPTSVLSSTQLCRSPGPGALETEASGASHTAGAGFLLVLARNANGIKKGPALHVRRTVLNRTERSASERRTA